jgi:hypothetical protein
MTSEATDFRPRLAKLDTYATQVRILAVDRSTPAARTQQLIDPCLIDLTGYTRTYASLLGLMAAGTCRSCLLYCYSTVVFTRGYTYIYIEARTKLANLHGYYLLILLGDNFEANTDTYVHVYVKDTDVFVFNSNITEFILSRTQ